MLDQVDLEARQCIFGVLLLLSLVMLNGISADEDENDDSLLQELFHVKGRLTCLLESNECIQDEGIEDGLHRSASFQVVNKDNQSQCPSTHRGRGPLHHQRQ